MLTRFHKILIGLLVVQIALIIVVATRGDDSAALKEQPLVASFDAAKVTRLQVFASATPKPAVDIVKRGASWVLASHFEYPVEEARVTDVLSPIAKLAAAAPLATQQGRHKQLKVADQEFERKLVVTVDGKDLTLILGNSVGARRTAIRLAGSDDVFGVAGLSAHTAGTEPRQWVATSYVKVARDEISRVTIQHGPTTVELARATPPAAGSGSAGSGTAGAAPEPFTASIEGAPIALTPGESLDTAAIDKLVGDATTIELAAPADPKRDAGRPTATITIERKTTGAMTPAPVVIDVIADGNRYWVHDRGHAQAVVVDKDRLDAVVGVERARLVTKPPPPPPPAAGAGSGEPKQSG